MIEEALASLKRGRERERERESRQTACAACVLCGRPTVATRMSQKGAITTVISCPQNDKSTPPPPKKQTNSVVTGPLWETTDDRRFSQRFSIKCVCFEVCARRPPSHTLVLKSIPNYNRLGNFPEILDSLYCPLVLDPNCPLRFSIKTNS